MGKDLNDKVGLRGKLEIFRYNADKTKLLYPPYVDDNVIVNTGRQAIRGLFADASLWVNEPSVLALWGDLQPVAVSDLYVDKMKLGVSSIAASPIDEELLAPIGTAGTGAVETAFVGNGVNGVGGVPFVPAFFILAAAAIPRSVVMTTWVDIPVGPISSTYIYGVDDGNGTITGSKDFYNGAAWITVSMSADINYATQTINNVVYSHPPTNGVNVDCMYQTAVVDVSGVYAGGVVYNDTFGTVPISHNTLHMVADGGGGVTGFIDDVGGGVLSGVLNSGGPITATGAINYTTGVIVINFSGGGIAGGVSFTSTYQVDWSAPVDVYFPNPYSIRFEVSLGVGDFIGYTFAEEGLFTDDTFDLMIARKAFTPFTKGAAEVVVFRHTILM